MSPEERTPSQQEALERLDDAIARFAPADAVQALYDSGVLDGIYRRLEIRFPILKNRIDYEHVIAQAVDALVAALDHQEEIDEPVGFLWTIAYRRAVDDVRRMQVEIPTASEKLSGRVLPVLTADPLDAIPIARGLLPRIRGDKPRAAVKILLDALEQGRAHVPAAEIAMALGISEVYARQAIGRGLKRLKRLADDEKLTGEGFCLPELDEDELLVAPDSDDEDDE